MCSEIWWLNLICDAEQFCIMCFGCQLPKEMPKGPWQGREIVTFGLIATFSDYVFVAINYCSDYFDF